MLIASIEIDVPKGRKEETSITVNLYNRPPVELRRFIEKGSHYTNIMLPKHNKFSNFFVIEIPVVFRRYFFLDKEAYIANLSPKPKRETRAERTVRYQQLMAENGWTRAELARQLGVSRAWVTKVLGTYQGGGVRI